MLIPSNPIMGWILVVFAAILLIIAGLLHFRDWRMSRNKIKSGRTVYRQNPETLELEEIEYTANGKRPQHDESSTGGYGGQKINGPGSVGIRVRGGKGNKVYDNLIIGHDHGVVIEGGEDNEAKRNITIAPTKPTKDSK